jgi:hypothetical protein
VSAAYIGEPLTADSDDSLREGPMVIPRLGATVTGRIVDALREFRIADHPS